MSTPTAPPAITLYERASEALHGPLETKLKPVCTGNNRAGQRDKDERQDQAAAAATDAAASPAKVVLQPVE